MTAIWRNDGTDWRLLTPVGFPDERTLHRLIEESPQLLPLAGSPRLAMVGSEVQLGNGYADLLAVESSGRMVVIEVKLARNPEARRAIVTQILTYAAYLHQMDYETLERGVLAKHLQARGFASLESAAASSEQEDAFDAQVFRDALEENLRDGRFRLVLVLDEAPPELVQLVGYLAVVAENVLIDLVTVRSYDVNGSQILVPQRVDPEYHAPEPPHARSAASPSTSGWLAEGPDDFISSVADVADPARSFLTQLIEWAKRIEAAGYARLFTYHGRTETLTTLLPYLHGEDVGLVTIYNDQGNAYLRLWRSVFLRRAPQSLELVEAAVAPAPVGQGTAVKALSPELLDALTEAYREAATGKLSLD